MCAAYASVNGGVAVGCIAVCGDVECVAVCAAYASVNGGVAVGCIATCVFSVVVGAVGAAVSGAVVNMMASSNLFFQAISGATGLLADIAQKLSPPTGTGDIPGLSPAVQGEVSTANNATRILGADLAKQLGDALVAAEGDVATERTRLASELGQGADIPIGAAGGATVGDILGPDMIAEAKKQTGILTSINKNIQNVVN